MIPFVECMPETAKAGISFSLHTAVFVIFQIYFECEERKSFVNVMSSQTLKDVLRDKR